MVLNGIPALHGALRPEEGLVVPSRGIVSAARGGPALEQVASPGLEEKVVLPLQEVQVVRGGGAEDASLAPDKTAGSLSLSDRNRITKTRRCSSGRRLSVGPGE